MKKLLQLIVILILSGSWISEAKAQCNASFTFSQDSGLVAFTSNSSSPPAGYYAQWYYGDGNYGYGQNTTHQYTDTGTYYVTLFITANDSSCWDSTMVQVTITSVPSAYTCHAYFTKDTIGNDPFHLQFNNQSTSSLGTLSYSWNFGDGNTSTLANPEHVYQSAGTYNVCLTVTNNSTGCSDTYCQTVYLQNNCFAAYSYTNPQPGTYIFTNHSTGSNLTYHWDFGDGNTSTNMNPTHTYAASGYYYITLTISSSTNPSCSSQYNGAVSVNLNPPSCNAEFYMFQDSLDSYHYYIVNTSTGSNLNYVWNFGDGTVDSTAYPTHTYQDTIPYIICLTVYGNNCQDSQCDTIFPGRSTGIARITVIPAPVSVAEEKSLSANLYPNPSDGIINLQLTEAVSGEMVIMDVSGRIIEKCLIHAGQGEVVNFDLSSLSKGTYLMRIITLDNGQINKTLIRR